MTKEHVVKGKVHLRNISGELKEEAFLFCS